MSQELTNNDRKNGINEPLRHLVRETTTPEGMKQAYTYDKYGNALTSKTGIAIRGWFSDWLTR